MYRVSSIVHHRVGWGVGGNMKTRTMEGHTPHPALWASDVAVQPTHTVSTRSSWLTRGLPVTARRMTTRNTASARRRTQPTCSVHHATQGRSSQGIQNPAANTGSRQVSNYSHHPTQEHSQGSNYSHHPTQEHSQVSNYSLVTSQNSVFKYWLPASNLSI